MYDKGKVIVGLVVFLGFATFPFYNNIGKKSAVPEPNLKTPVIEQMVVKKCIEPKEIMRGEHMQILNQWRDTVVREGERKKMTIGGVEIDTSLQKGCLHCHSNKKKFCDACHNYLSVKPYCWDCHFDPKERDV